jgi:hypothetical protein
MLFAAGLRGKCEVQLCAACTLGRKLRTLVVSVSNSAVIGFGSSRNRKHNACRDFSINMGPRGASIC